MTFHVGQKVVCIRAGAYYSGALDTGLRLNAVYTVARIYEGGLMAVAEIPTNDICDALNKDRFRPVVERKTDISIFTAMLLREKVRA